MLLNLLKRLIPLMAFSIAIIIWSGLPAMTKLALSGMSISLFISIRFLCSSLFLFPFALPIIKKVKQLSINKWLCFISTITIMFYSQTWAIQQIPAIVYIVVFSATPVLMALCLRYQMQWQAFLGLIVVILALSLFVYDGKAMSIWSVPAILSMVISMGSWIAYTILIKQLHDVFNDLEITIITCFSAAFVSLMISFFSADFTMLSELPLTTIIFAGLIGLILPMAFLGYSYALRKIPIVSIFGQYLEPVVGIVLTSVLLGGTVSLKQGLSIICLLFGIGLLSNFSQEQKVEYITPRE